MQIEELRLDQLIANESNPNEMDDRQFNALCASLQEEGWVEPIQVVPIVIDDAVVEGYQIVGGHHRVQAAIVLGWETCPAVILDPVKFDQDRQDWAMVKLNVLRGNLNPIKFTELYSRLTERYAAETMQTLMGFTSEEAFKRLFVEVRRSLPPELADALGEVREEIKTIDDLSLVLNRLFREYGETLPSNMMVFSWGGREVLWIRTDDKTWKIVSEIAKDAASRGADVSELFGTLLAGALIEA